MNHPTAQQWSRTITAIRRLLDTIETEGPELFRRDGHTSQPDGYPTSSLGGDGRGGTTSSSTETAALAEERSDVIHLDALGLRHNLLRLHEYANAAVGCISHARQHSSNRRSDHGPSGCCVVCDRHVEGTAEDRLRRGMCEADFRAWLRAGRPDVVEFRRHRTEETAA